MIYKGFIAVVATILLSMYSFNICAQISSPTANYTEAVDYSSTPVVEADSVYIFCGKESDTNAVLKIEGLQEGETFAWEKYNPGVGFEPYDATTEQIEGLEDGGYRCVINNGAETREYRAWVANFWSKPSAEINESNCEFFKLSGGEEHSSILYYDIFENNSDEAIALVVQVEYSWEVPWMEGELSKDTIIVYDLKASEDSIDISLGVTYLHNDSVFCVSNTSAKYGSIVPKAGFSYNPRNGEAPLVVDFSSTSINADEYQWYLFKSEEDLSEVSIDPNAELVDSLLDVFDQGYINPIENENFDFTYFRPGDYKLSLVVTNSSQGCKDSLFMQGAGVIKVDTSWVTVPNVFTPNNDGMNDTWVIETTSVRALDVNVYNRYGKSVHSWESSDIRSSDEITRNAVWDGTILGNNLARTGVYFYVIKAIGWDDKKLYKKGNIHVFTDEKKF